jgi:hypothetical protein
LKRRLLSLGAMLALAGCAAFEDGPPASRLQGEVRAWPEGTLVPGAVIRVKDREVKADAKGAYVLDGLGEAVSLEVSGPRVEAQNRTPAALASAGLAPRKRDLVLVPGETRRVDLWLAATGEPIAPRMLFERGGKIWEADALGTHVRNLTQDLPGTQSSPSWVEPGRHFAFIQRQPSRTHVWIRATETMGPLEPASRYLAQVPDSASELRYSAAGKRFAFTVAVRSPHLGMRNEIRELDAYSGAMRDLVGGSGISANPVFSPDGKQLAWARRLATGTWQIWVSGPRGESSRALLATGNCMEPAWSPSGQQLAYTSNLEGSWDIYFTSVDLAESTRPVGIRLTRSPEGGFSRRPVWGPDGEILFESNFHPGTGKIQSGVDLYAVKVSTGRIRQVLPDARSADW